MKHVLLTLFAMAGWAVPLASAVAGPPGEPFACNVKALTPDQRVRYKVLTGSLLAAVREKRELDDGYAFRLPPEAILEAAEWISLERKCCPFFTFDVQQKRDEGPLWLRVTGSEGVKEFIRAEFGL